MSDICVVHLVWKPFGLEPLREFVASYRRNPGGVTHRLVIAFKGFGDEPELDEYRQVLSGIPYEPLVVSSHTLDIGSYFEAARKLQCEYLCFLNSNSRLLDPEWLAKMYKHARREGVGVVGATGSWQSHHSLKMYAWGERCAYTDAMFDVQDHIHRQVGPPRFQMSDDLKRELRRRPLPRRLALWLYYFGLVAPRCLVGGYVRFRLAKRKDLRRFPAADYDPFPAFHIRTNAFMIRRELMLKLKTWEMTTKDDAYRFESGKRSMTNQVLRMGREVLVVGRDGRAYEKERWPQSETLFQGEQRNLLVADNLTKQYSESDALSRTILSRGAWGQQSWTFPSPGGSEAAS